MIFIDAEYVIQRVKDIAKSSRISYRIYREDINWYNLIKWIATGRHLIRTYYYSAEFNKEENPRTYSEQQKYFHELKINIPFLDVKLGRLVKVQNGWMQKGLDVKIAVDMLSKAFNNQYDIAALISGDADFAEVIIEVKERYGKQVELYTLDDSINDMLRYVPDRHIIITPQLNKRYNFWTVP